MNVERTPNCDALLAAVELHRPATYDKYGYVTADPERVVSYRCGECVCSVPPEGCPTWRTAHAR
jgi:ribosomal protein L34E